MRRAAETMFAITVALGLREANDAVEPLLRVDDPDVRFASSLYFDAFNPEYAAARHGGLCRTTNG
jgi:hypothetical protein